MSNIKAEYGTRKTLPISVGALSEIGLREENQDNMSGFSSPLGSVYMIADGMGGYRGGAEASRLVTEGFRKYISEATPGLEYWEVLSHAAQQTNRDLMERSASGDPQNSGMGSTAVLAVIREGESGLELITGHVGDSRVYVHRGGVLTLLTKDHTRVQWLIDSHALDETSARLHPEASVLTRAFGHTADMVIDVSKPIMLADGDGILLCSDGLSGFAGSDDINKVIQEYPDPTECARQLVQLALARGSNDNITVQFIRVGQSPRSVAKAPVTRRQTLPEGPAFPSVSQVVVPKKASSLQSAILGLLLGGLVAGVLIFLFREKLFPPIKPATAYLKAQVQTDPAAIPTSNDETVYKAIQDQQGKIETNLGGLKAHGKGELAKRLKDLKGELAADRTRLNEYESYTACEPAGKCDKADALIRFKKETLDPLLTETNKLFKEVAEALNAEKK